MASESISHQPPICLTHAYGMSREERQIMRGIPAPGKDGAIIPRVRRGIGVAIVVAAAMSLSACGTSGPAGSSSGSSPKGLTMWALNDQTILKASVDAYNKDHPNQKITLRLFANDDYKQKLRVAFGANQAPDLFFNWGGGRAGRLRQGGQGGRRHRRPGEPAALHPQRAEERHLRR
ncbi:hypothetical protein QFZ66_004594 [Streptomyces sp. B4I13]|nr:hypothetical protein [Streptomyces sp. B4I13]